jgi:hypothetical protein
MKDDDDDFRPRAETQPRLANSPTEASKSNQASTTREGGQGPGPVDRRHGRQRALVAWVGANPLPAVTLLGVVLYGVLRLSYLFFYLRLRTNPEEVGYGYTQILAQSATGGLLLVALVFFALLLSAGCLWGVKLVVRKLRRRDRRPNAALPVNRHAIQASLLRALAASLAIVIVGLPMIAWWQGGLAQRGQVVRNLYFVGVPYLPVLAVQAVPAQVSWIDPASNQQLDLGSRNCLMYLGEADGIAVFYDVSSHESLRLPASDLVISFRYAYFVDESCRNAS